MKKIILALTIVCLLMLSSCQIHLEAGTVVDKQFQPAHKTYSTMIMHIGKTTHVMPRWIHHPDKWFVWVQNGEITDCWDVGKEFYESVNIGDWVERQ